MGNAYIGKELLSESDVEQKFVYKLLTQEMPIGLGYSDFDFRTKVDIRKLAIDKGTKKKLYYPDYAIIVDGLPAVIIEAKTPDEDAMEAVRQARLYATEINSSYPRNINPCERIIVTDGKIVIAGFWDEDEPVIKVSVEDFDPLNPKFVKLVEFASKKTILSRSQEILKSIKRTARYFKPVFMLGGNSVINETVGENSFGANVSVEYKYLFNPESPEDRKAIINNAYIKSKRKQSHVSPIDRLIRAAIPKHMIDARKVDDTGNPDEILHELNNKDKVKNEICLLIGSVGSGKSTFTDYLWIEALPEEIRYSTEWVNLNLNKAPLDRKLIYEWVLTESIKAIENKHSNIDFDHIETLHKIYARELKKVKKGKAALYPKDSEKYIEAIYSEIDKLQNDKISTLNGIINYLYASTDKLLVIVLDNCDKRNRDDQLLMFEVSSWLKNTFPCMVFLPIRDTTYDLYRDEPPLDTVIKDLVFRIDPPLLAKVIYKRLNYAIRDISSQNSDFEYYLPNGMRVSCDRDEVSQYLKCIVASLFQDNLFRRIISGIAGRNIRKGLEILMDFCKSGHINESEIFKIRQSTGEYKLPKHLIAKILLKGKRKYYSDEKSHLKNLFCSDDKDALPNPFVRIAILQWLKDSFRVYGPNRIKGYHKISALLRSLQSSGHPIDRALEEISVLVRAGCINSEAHNHDLNPDDLISIAPSGFIHLDLLKNVNYLSSVAEDSYFRENQVAKHIADNMIGRGTFLSDSKQTAISNSKLLVDYMSSYYKQFFLGAAKVLEDCSQEQLIDIDHIREYVNRLAENDDKYKRAFQVENEYPPGSLVEAQIVSIQTYGLFVEFGLNGYGLIHKSNFNSFGHEIIDNCETGDWVIVEIVKYNEKHNGFDLKLDDI